MYVRRPYKRGEYPIDFVPSSGEALDPAFDQIGLTGNTEGRRHAAKKWRNALADSGNLFMLVRPTADRTLPAYYHPPYLQAAFIGAPHVQDFHSKQAWLAEITDHLENFATQPEAREVIAAGVTTYYNQITEAAVCIPGQEGGAWIAAYESPGEICPLDLVGVSPRSVCKVEKYRDNSITHRGEGKVFLRLDEIANYVSWIIPEVEAEATRTAIMDAFEVTHVAGRAAHPRALFEAGSVIMTQGVELSTATLFKLPDEPACEAELWPALVQDLHSALAPCEELPNAPS